MPSAPSLIVILARRSGRERRARIAESVRRTLQLTPGEGRTISDGYLSGPSSWTPGRERSARDPGLPTLAEDLFDGVGHISWAPEGRDVSDTLDHP